MADHIGRVLGDRYRLLAPIGSGSSGHVFVADDVRLRRRVAVKMLHPALADDDAFLRRFRAEARAAAALNHPNVMAVYDWGEGEEGPYLVCEHLGGGSLRSVLDRGRRLSPSQALLIGLEAARGLDYAHRRGLVHRDIKPANLLFDDDGRLRIGDFGLARALAEAAWTEPIGAVLGTARYASPEQVSGAPIDGRADVYSLALVLVEAVTGRVPFAADTTVATLMGRLDRPIEAPPELGPLAAVVARAGRADPAERLDAAGLASALQSAALTLPTPEPLPLAGPAPVEEVGSVDDPTDVGPRPGGPGRPPAAAAVAPPVPGPPVPGPPVTPSPGPTSAGPAVPGQPAATGRAPADPDATVLDASVLNAPVFNASVLKGAPVLRGAGLDATGPVATAGPEATGATPAVSAASRRRGAADATVVQGAGLRGATVVQGAVAPTRASRKAGRRATVAETPALSRRGRRRRRRWPYVVLLLLVLGGGVGGGSYLLVSGNEAPSHPLPSVIGLTELEAGTALRQLNFEVDVSQEYFDASIPGQVRLQDPSGGGNATLQEGKRVTLVISKGPAPTAVPDLAGLDQAGAGKALEAVGHVLGAVTTEHDETVDEGLVLSWTKKGESPPKGATVDLVVSAGAAPRTVPNLAGNTFDEATASLAAIGLEAERVDTYTNDDDSAGKVIAASPAAGASAARGSTVTLTLSKGRPAVPKLNGLSAGEAAAALEAVGLEVGSQFGPSGGEVFLSLPGEGSKVAPGASVTIYLL